MLKSLALGAVLIAGLGATAGQARTYDVWGHTFTTDDGIGASTNFPSTPPTSFSALAAPGQHRLRMERLRDLEQTR